MNIIEELKIHVGALVTAMDFNSHFFASIIHYVKRLNHIVCVDVRELTQEELVILAKKIEEFYKEWRPSREVDLYVPPRETSDTDTTERAIYRTIMDLSKLNTEEFKNLLAPLLGNQTPNRESNQLEKLHPCIFIGHGQSQLWARLKIFLEDELHLVTITYEKEPHAGESIIPILERFLDQSTFAILVFTAEDDTTEGTKRARQNVVHEAGLFQGRLGFNKVVLLLQSGVEEFTNIGGLQHIPFQKEHIDQTFYELQRVLKREKQIIK